MDGTLSQEEINALLNGDLADEAAESDKVLTNEEKDAVGEVANISMGTAATTLFSLVNQKVTITTPVVECVTWENIIRDYDRPCVFIQISYKDGLDGKNILILKEHDVKVITDLMMGGDGTNTDGELGELHLSAISEAMNQMMGSSATSLSNMINRMVDISPPESTLVDLNDNFDEESVAPFLRGVFVKVTFRMEIGDLVDSQIMQLYPMEFARSIYESFMAGTFGGGASENAAPQPDVQPEPQPVPAPAPAPQPTTPPQQAAPQGVATGMPQQQPMMDPNMFMGAPQGMPMMPYMQAPYNVQPAQFQPFNGAVNMANQPENIDLIMDVPLDVTVELGRTSKSIHDILEFTPGTIIELNKIAGEPVDVLVNGKYVAKGEVVVIEESFGVRITEIVR